MAVPISQIVLLLDEIILRHDVRAGLNRRPEFRSFDVALKVLRHRCLQEPPSGADLHHASYTIAILIPNTISIIILRTAQTPDIMYETLARHATSIGR